MIKVLIVLAAVCLLEGIAIYFALRRMTVIKGQAKASAAALAAANRELEGVQNLLHEQKTTKEEANHEKQELQDTPDAGLAGRANGLFGS